MRAGDNALLSARTEEGQVFPTCPEGQEQPVQLRSGSDTETILRANCAIRKGQLRFIQGFTMATRSSYTFHSMVLACGTEVFKGDVCSSKLGTAGKRLNPAKTKRHAKVTAYQPGARTTRDSS